MSGKSPYPKQGAYPTQGSYNAGPMPPPPTQRHPAPGPPPAYVQAQQMPPAYAPPGGAPAPAQYYPHQGYPQQGYPAQPYPQMQPGGTVHVQGGFAAGARFDAGSTANVPPPPPGAVPNAAQAGIAMGQNVVVTQRQGGDFWEGQGANTGINMGW